MTTPRWQATSRRPAVTHVSARRSRFVGLMKFVLPLGAAILLVLVVVWSGTGTRDEGFQLSFVSGGADGSPTPGMVKARSSPPIARPKGPRNPRPSISTRFRPT
jgi:hypothetical protein